MRRARGRRRQAVRLFLLGMAVAHLAEAIHLRRRLRALWALDTVAHNEGDTVSADKSVVDELDVVAAQGVEVGPTTLRAVADEMAATDAEVVDLVPGDLPAERAMRLLRRVDADRLTSDPMYLPGGAHEALVSTRSVAERMEGRAPGARASGVHVIGRDELMAHTRSAHRCALTSRAMWVAPDLRAGSAGPTDRWDEVMELTAPGRPQVSLAPGVVAAETAQLVALTAGVVAAPVAGLAALAAWCVKPALVFGTQDGRTTAKVRPRDLAWSSWLRLPLAWRENVCAALAGRRQARAEALRRPAPQDPPTLDKLFEPRRQDCPWCGSEALVGRVDVTDVVQHKPGRFHLDECAACGHVFQNPVLSTKGLDYYYDNFYEGLGAEAADAGFRSFGAADRMRADAVGQFTKPRAWLDVGTGHGHFCLATRQRWPDTVFDGLDMGQPVEDAERRGWVDHAYRGLFPELADQLAESYDVVSMHQYLEHTLDPRLEIAAAAKVLEPSGYLEIDVPDPESPWGRWLGRHWFLWVQPQHVHFVPCQNLVDALGEAGFEVVAVQRGEATGGFDVTGAVVMLVSEMAPSPHLPWLARPSLGRRMCRVGLFAAALPVSAVTLAVDLVKDTLLRRPGSTRVGSVYRVVARKQRAGELAE